MDEAPDEAAEIDEYCGIIAASEAVDSCSNTLGISSKEPLTR